MDPQTEHDMNDEAFLRAEEDRRMAEQQTRPRNEPAERLRYGLTKGDREIDTNDLWMSSEDADNAVDLLDAALREQTRITVERIREVALAFWSDEAVKNDHAFHPSLLWRFLDEVAALPRTPADDRAEAEPLCRGNCLTQHAHRYAQGDIVSREEHEREVQEAYDRGYNAGKYDSYQHEPEEYNSSTQDRNEFEDDEVDYVPLTRDVANNT